MPEKYKCPWRLQDFLEGNAVHHTLSLSWEFRLELLERLAKILSDLHRKQKAYGFGGLNSANVMLLSSDRSGVKSLEKYPEIIQKDLDGKVTDLSKLDMLCLGVIMLELMQEKPLIGNKLPQVVALLRRKGLGNIRVVQNGSLKAISSIKESGETKEQEVFLQKEMIREDLLRKDFDPEKELNDKTSKPSVRQVLNTRRTQAQQLIGNLVTKGLNFFRKKKDLKKEREITENKVFEAFVKQKSTDFKGHTHSDVDEFVMNDIIKEEVKAYIRENETKLERPTWMINLHELVVSLLTSVDDSRPTAKAARSFTLEVLESFKKSKMKHDEVKKAMEDPDFMNMDDDKKKNKLEYSATMRKGDYIQQFHMYGLFYTSRPIEIILDDMPSVKGEVLILHTKDVTSTEPIGDGYDSDDSVMPPEKKDEDLQSINRSNDFPNFSPPPTRNVKRPDSTVSLDFVMENDPPPIIGPKADALLGMMENQRREIGKMMSPTEVAKLFDQQKKIPHAELVNILKKAREILDAEPNVLTIDAPVIVVGDIHGQYFDLRQVMKFCGRPKRRNASKGVWKSKAHDQEEQKRRKSRQGAKGIMGKSKKDKSVFNQEEFVKDFEELKKADMETRRQSRKQLSLNKRKTKQRSLAPPPMTKTLTLGRKLDLEAASEASSAVIVEDDDDKGKTFLFLGDYIDRGSWSCEVLFYLLSIKVHYPESTILLRGNHECDTMAETYGFREECEHKYGREVYHRCVQVFSSLPIACLVNLPDGKRFLACHGGISEKITSLDQIAKLERRREPGVEGVLCDLLWSDPVPDDVVHQHGVGLPFEKIEFIPNETRGCAKKFGYKALESFLRNNELLGIIRAHEAKEEGFMFHFQNAGSKDHICITVFSAPNYMNEHGNKGAVMIVHKTVKDRLLHQMKRLQYKYTVDQVLKQQDNKKDDYLDLLEPICYHEVEQPEVVAFEHENYNIVKQIEDTCPYMPTNIDEFYNSSLDILERYGNAQEQLITYQKDQQLQAQQIKEEWKDIQEMKKKFEKNGGDSKKSKFYYESMRLKASSKALRTMGSMGTLRKSKTNLRSSVKDMQHDKFAKTLKRVKETHPQLMSERIRIASNRMEKMDLAKNDDDLNLPSGPNVLSHENIATLKRGRGLSQGATPADANDLLRQEPEKDNQAVVEQINARSYMKRERVEIEFKNQWVEVISYWFSNLAGKDIVPDGLCESLVDCSLLCEAVGKIVGRELKFTKPKMPSDTLSIMESRLNLIVFQDACKELGILKMFLIIDLKNGQLNYVLPTLVELARKAHEKGVLDLGLGVDMPEHLFKGTGNASNDLMGDLKKGLEVGNVTFDGEERLMLQLLFLMIDLDDSGFITADAIITWAREENKLIRPPHAAKVISAIDYDNDGKIGLRDFFQYAAKLKEEFLTEEFEEYEEYETADEDEENLFFTNQPQNMVAETGDVFDPNAAVNLNDVENMSDDSEFLESN